MCSSEILSATARKKRTLELGELRLDVARALAAVDVHLVDGRLHLHLRLFDLHLLLVCHGEGATTHLLIDELGTPLLVATAPLAR